MIFKIILGLLLIPITGWVITFIPFPSTLPIGMFNYIAEIFVWFWALNSFIPIDTLFILFMILISIDIAEAILHFSQFITKHFNN